MIYSVVANHRQPHITYNVIQRRYQPRAAITYEVYTYIKGEMGGKDAAIVFLFCRTFDAYLPSNYNILVRVQTLY